MRQLKNLMSEVLNEGEDRGDRTGVGTRSLFGCQMEFDLQQGFPICTSKFVPFRLIMTELFWFLQGSTNVGYLQANNCRIWDEWADEDGNLGPVYGHQWRHWGSGETVADRGTDQFAEALNLIKKDPTNRRIIVSAWNVGKIPDMKLPPCHMMFQFYVRKGQFLDCKVYQRSADLFLGVPFNISSYALLIHLMAVAADLRPGRLIWSGGDCHIYRNHYDQVRRYLDNSEHPLPLLYISPMFKDYLRAHQMAAEGFYIPTVAAGPGQPAWIDDKLHLVNYKYAEKIKAPVAV